MDLPKIRYGSSVRKEVMDDKTVKTTTTKFHKGKSVATNRLTIRERIPTDKFSVSDLESRFHKLVSDPHKIDPMFSVVAGTTGGSYDIVIEYTVLEV
jgi:hypothetical protein